MEDGALVLSHDAPLPEVCMKCGAHDGIVRRDVVFSWSPVWVRYLVFCIIGVVLQFIVRARASLVVPLCARCNARWSAARYTSTGSIVLLVVAIAVRQLLQEHPVGRFLGIGMFAVVVLVHFTFVRRRVLPVHHIDEEEIAFKNVNADAAKEILDGARP